MDLFDLIDAQIEDEKPLSACSHKEEDPTETVWPGESWQRWTWTCRRCGRVTGRAISVERIRRERMASGAIRRR